MNNTFGYDAMGNPTSWKGQARTFNLNNQETTGGPFQFAYDGNGNPTTYKGSTFAFDESDKLTRITTSGVVSLQAGYRSDGLRAWKNTSNGTTYFLYDGDQLVCEFDGNGNLKNTNIWGANGLLARQSGTTLTNFVWDDRGNIAQSLNADGSVGSSFNVSAWGDVRRDTQTSGAYFGLGGQFGNYLDVETGLLLCGQRYYDAAAGRWINRDPISYAGGLNVYGYVGNNPVNFTDPQGLARKAVEDMGCDELSQWIDWYTNDLRNRWDAMIADKWDQYPYYDKPNPAQPKGKGTWKGHQDQYKQRQDYLRRLLDAYDDKGCEGKKDENGNQKYPINNEADDWVEKPAPNKPARKSKRDRPKQKVPHPSNAQSPSWWDEFRNPKNWENLPEWRNGSRPGWYY